MESSRARGDAGALRHVELLAFVFALAPLAVSAVVVLLDGGGAYVRDHALMELRVRDIGHETVPLGLYSRDGWSHPGPLLYYTLALPYRLTGGDPNGLLVGALAINAGAIAGMALIARRLGGTAAALLTLVGASVVARSLGAELVRDPWVCLVTVLPFGLFGFVMWALISGRAWALPAGAALASWLVHAHVGYAPLTVPLLVLGAVWLCVAARRAHDDAQTRRVVRAGATTAVVLVVAWLPPVWDQLWGSGNLGRMIEWFADAEEGTHTLAEGARVVLGQLAAVPDWASGTRRDNPINGETVLRYTTLWPVLLVPFLGAAVVAWRRREGAVVRLAVVVAVLLAVSIVSVARTVGTMFDYRLLWTWMLGAFAVLVVAWTAWNAVVRRWPRAHDTVLVPVTLAALATLCIVQVVDIGRVGASGRYSHQAESVTRQIAASVDRDGGEVLLRSESFVSEWMLQGILLGLERRGIDARVSDDDTNRFGEHRVANGGPVEAHLVVLAEGDLDGFVRPANYELVAYDGPVPLEARVEIGGRVAAQEARLLAALESGALDRDEFRAASARVEPIPGPTLAVFREAIG